MSGLTGTDLTPTRAARPSLLAPLAMALLAGIALLLLYAVAFDQGQLQGLVRATAGNSMLHEYFHDARHILGFPCH